jgi:nitrite reductase (NADH) large subunit
MCGCTDLGHDDVRRLIKAKELKTIPAVMQELEWKTSCGCAKCRPALNYYLVCDWPDEYADDYQSRFINERVHANIQKDGTYSVVPRMWGGVTNAKELRAIADVVDKFEIPMVKVTGGQRIDLLGIEKEDLPAVWADLGKAGFISGQAYAKGLRTVKTCVGSDWCRFGTQDSTGLGIRIEKFMWGSWTPAKLKLAVSGCPRNCAEATCKDIGVICVDSGFEIHFAGAAGLDIKGTEVLGLVKTEDEALEHIVALTRCIASRAAISSASTNGPSASASTRSAGRSWTMRTSAKPITSASSSARNLPRSIPGRSASPARTSMNSSRWRRSAMPRLRSEEME